MANDFLAQIAAAEMRREQRASDALALLRGELAARMAPGITVILSNPPPPGSWWEHALSAPPPEPSGEGDDEQG